MEFESIIGLEVHAELLTKTKIFCSCKTEFGGEPNTHICPVCMGLPGALPRLNKRVVELGVKAGLVLNCEINKISKMNRKNFYYPDCPKNYQITQDDVPLCKNGYIDIEVADNKYKRIGIERIHIEEDAGKQIHEKNNTLVDFNRAGIPLIEIVSKPDIKTAEEAVLYLTKLKSILSSSNISDCKMEEGSLRCDVNISVKPKDTNEFGVRTEIKNMNSFKALEKALNYEFNRQVNSIKNGERLSSDTRRWDETLQRTIIMRQKEKARDYRYFPDGDLVTINLKDRFMNDIKNTIEELPHEMEERFIKNYNIPKYDARVLTSTLKMAQFFDEVAKISKEPKLASNWIMGDLSRLLNENKTFIENLRFNPSDLANLITLIKEGCISNSIGKQVIEEMFYSGKSPKIIIEEKGLKQNNNKDIIKRLVNEVLDNNPKALDDYKSGKTKIIGFIVGQVMKSTKGRSNPKIVNEIIIEEITRR